MQTSDVHTRTLKIRQKKLHEKIKNLIEKLPEENATRKELASHQELLDDAVNYLSKPNQKLAFIGNIGIGKTYAICHLLELFHKNKPVLSTSSGRTTLCEVEIIGGDNLEIEVTPHSPSDIESYLSDFAQYLKSSGANNTNSEEEFNLSKEVETALRAMLNLKKEKNLDPAESFADEYSSAELLKEALIERIDLHSRQQKKFIYDNELDQNEWLQCTFKSINYGSHPHVSLAKHIRIQVPIQFLNGFGFNLSVVDTKGVDDTVNRQDLDNCLEDNRAIRVLCGGFNDAPDKTMTSLLQQAKNLGFKERIAKETVLLILDKHDEAEEVSEDGDPVGDKEIGRAIKKDIIAETLTRKYELNDVDIQFFNAKVDDPEPLKQFLVDKVAKLRQQYESTINDIEDAVDALEKELSSQTANSAKKQVKNTLEPWLPKAQNCHIELDVYFSLLVQTIEAKGTYAASVRASVSRKGNWPNLDYYYLLSSGARGKVVKNIEMIHDELVTLIDNMLAQNNLQPAYSFLKQLKNIADKRLEDIYQTASSKGRSAYEKSLPQDAHFWRSLFNEWGKGSGYKNRIAEGTSRWFHENDHKDIECLVTERIAQKWQGYVSEVQGLLGSA